MAEYLYRYTSFDFGDEGEIDVRLKCERYRILSHTPKGVRIDTDNCKWKGGKFVRITKWVSNTAKKRFAYPTQEEALVGLYWRKKRQIVILNWQMRAAEEALLRIREEAE